VTKGYLCPVVDRLFLFSLKKGLFIKKADPFNF